MKKIFLSWIYLQKNNDNGKDISYRKENNHQIDQDGSDDISNNTNDIYWDHQTNNKIKKKLKT